MSPKEENDKLVAENAQLVKTNADICESINFSKLALKEAKEQEAAGKTILASFANELETAQNAAESAKRQLAQIESELTDVLAKKTKAELAISEVEKQAEEDPKKAKTESEAELAKLHTTIQIKREEVVVLLNKIKTETSNLITIKDETSLLSFELSKAQSAYDDVVAKCAAKDEELDNLYTYIEGTKKELEKAKQTLKDTEISTEAYEDRKATLIAEIVTLNDEINTLKMSIVSINAEITELQAQKEIKEAEYNGSVSKIFDLMRREEAVAEREAYAKGRFKDAGLEY